MFDLLRGNPLLLLFVVTALGFALGRVRFFGIRLGAAAVLFVGLALGALDPQLGLPDFVVQLGLVLYLYALGLANGANFFRAFRREGGRQIALILLLLTLPAAAVLLLVPVLEVSGAEGAGLFAGIGTNTAALAGLLDLISGRVDPPTATPLIAQTAVAFAIGYPAGVLGRIILLSLLQRLWGIDFQAEAHQLREIYPFAQEIVNRAIRVTRPEATGRPLRELQRERGWDVIFGRLWRDGELTLVSGESTLKLGDTIVIAGEKEEADEVVAVLGEIDTSEQVINDRIYVKRRIFVSNPDLVGQPLAALDLKERYGAIVTRVRRGDSDLLAGRGTILELGDRVRVLARRSEMGEITELFGDSYEAVSRVNLLSLGFGISAGLLLGMVRLALPGGIDFQVGFAVGTLIVALILGALRRTGALVWTLPYSTNQTIQEVGLFLLLAGIGVRSGNALETAVAGLDLLILAGMGVGIVLLTILTTMFIGYRLLRIPFSILAGMVASQPAVLRFVEERAGNPLPGVGFTLAIPIGIILKVIYAQILFALLVN